MSTKILDPDTLTINGQDAKQHHADVRNALAALTMTETITGASSVQMTLRDPKRNLITSGLLDERAAITLDGAPFGLSAINRQGNALVVTFEDLAVSDLRLKKGFRKAAAGTTSRVQFCRTLIGEVSWIKMVTAPGATAKVELARGSKSTSTASPQEDTWTAVGRIVGDIGWRAMARRGVVTLASDSHLISHAPARYTLSPASKGVIDIDFDYNVGKPAASATITCFCGEFDLIPGEPVTLSGLGPANGHWLVQDVERTFGSTQATVTLIQPQPVLPEPKKAKTTTTVTDDIGVGGYTSQEDEKSGPKSASTKVEKFVQYALTAKGHRYRWGASGPNEWDCSGLVQWAALQVGVHFSKPVTTMIQHVEKIPVAEAVRTRGALLLRSIGKDDHHVAISLGNGQTIEAHSTASGCGVYSAGGRTWTTGGIIPALAPPPEKLHGQV